MDLTKHDYLFILQKKDFSNSNRPIYKIGGTDKFTAKSFQNYLEVMIVICCSVVREIVLARQDLVQIFKEHFIPRPNFGVEFFEGDLKTMEKLFFEVVNRYALSISTIQPPNFPPKVLGGLAQLSGRSANYLPGRFYLDNQSSSSVSQSSNRRSEPIIVYPDSVSQLSESVGSISQSSNRRSEPIIVYPDSISQVSEPASSSHHLAGLSRDPIYIFFEAMSFGQIENLPLDLFELEGDQKVWVCIDLYAFLQDWLHLNRYTSRISRNNFIRYRFEIQGKKRSYYHEADRTWYLLEQSDILHESYVTQLKENLATESSNIESNPLTAKGRRKLDQFMENYHLEVTHQPEDQISTQQFAYLWSHLYSEDELMKDRDFISKIVQVLGLLLVRESNGHFEEYDWIVGLRDNSEYREWSDHYLNRYWIVMDDLELFQAKQQILDRKLPCCDQTVRSLNWTSQDIFETLVLTKPENLDQIQGYFHSHYRPILECNEIFRQNYRGYTAAQMANFLSNHFNQRIQSQAVFLSLVDLGFHFNKLSDYECDGQYHIAEMFEFHLVPL